MNVVLGISHASTVVTYGFNKVRFNDQCHCGSGSGNVPWESRIGAAGVQVILGAVVEAEGMENLFALPSRSVALFWRCAYRYVALQRADGSTQPALMAIPVF